VTVAFIGLGANLGQPHRQLELALAELDRLPQTRLVRRSSLYRSAPMGYPHQPEFVNAVAQLETSLPPARLLTELQAIEQRHGRQRRFANAPRTLDLDVLLFGGAILNEPGLTLPHPRMHERAFVLMPLLEIAPEATIPGRGAAIDLLSSCKNQRVERIA
jgi:2-amino-4-hydroxy-6-hydroxymethyldihydropteridine diphosphokinase